jgi:hypothetical protein
MLNHIKNNNEHVKFIEYTGAYPNLCRGVLTLEIDGEIVKFGYTYNFKEEKNEPNRYDSFWESGGNCGFTNNYSNSYVNSGEWIINESEIPEKYKKYALEIDEVFNDNVQQGCCGGCL